jgi:hypothetical protein
MATPSQIDANRANAQFSTGPSSPEGKLASSLNALKTGLTGRTILLPSDDVAAYEQLVSIVTNQWRPETDPERLLVQSMADTQWRLLRIPTLESAVWALGRAELAGEHASESNPQLRSLMIDVLILRNYKSELSNLTLQESRLQRHLERVTAQFTALRAEREVLPLARRNRIMMDFLVNEYDPAKFGFEFSPEYLFARLDIRQYAGPGGLAIFDRSWRDKTSSTPD